MKLLGLGRAQLQLLPERGMRLDLDALEAVLDTCARAHQPVLIAVAVLGTTEYGTIDPVDGVVDARDRFAARGLGFGVHVDGAWGGYLATLFRNADGSLRTLGEVRNGFEAFPATEVHAAFGALGRTDSVTVDPHKLGYLPYGAGAFVCRDHRAMALLAEQADYVFHEPTPDGYLARYRSLGQFIIEGSKPGATAAAVHVTHKVLPLDHANFGRLQAQTIVAAEAFYARAQCFAGEMSGLVQTLVPFAPDSNLVCLALNPAGNRDVSRANAFTRRLHEELRCNPRQPLQVKEFFGSVTSLRPDVLGETEMQRILLALGLDPVTLGGDNDDRLLILRHTLMNPYLIDRENGVSYIDLYFEFLARRMRLLLEHETKASTAPGEVASSAEAGMPD